MDRPIFKTEGDFEDYCDRIERERYWWRTALRRELEARYSLAETERIMNIKRVLMKKELEHERTSGKSIETESVGNGSRRGENVLDGMEECKADV